MNQSKIMDDLRMDLYSAETWVDWLDGIIGLLHIAYEESKADESNRYAGAFKAMSAMLGHVQDAIDRGGNDLNRLRELLEGTGAEEAEVGA